MALWIAVHGTVDGETLDADTINRPIYELAERTNYLYDRLNSLYGSGVFEAVRLTGVALDVGSVNSPSVKDFVYLDAATNTYKKASATMRLDDVFIANANSYPVGILIAAAGGQGTVLLNGKCPLSTNGTAWTMTDLLEEDEVFRIGPYYLSSTEPGKMTAYPSGPMVYVGYFMDTYAIINPQYRDTGEAHVHRTFTLSSQPVGRQLVTNEGDPSGYHDIIGYLPLVTDDLDRKPSLVVYGTYTGSSETQYSIILTNQFGNGAPDDFSNSWIHWTSSDPDEGEGDVRVSSFELPFVVGTKGLICALENPTGNSWDYLYSADYSEDGDSDEKRTWVVNVPTDCKGWLARKYRQVFVPNQTDAYGYTFRLMGGPLSTTDDRIADTLSISCLDIYSLSLEEPNVGDTTVIGSNTYEYTDDVTAVTAGNTAVELTGTANLTFKNLIAAILATDTTVVPVLEPDVQFFVGAPSGTVITHLGVTPAPLTGAGSIDATANLLVYDQNNETLISTGDGGYWHNPTYWTPITLVNGLQIMPVPYSVTGDAAQEDLIDEGMSWACDIVDEAPGANFVYAVGMHSGLTQYYPPIPVNAASVVLNGVELDSADLFTSNPTYKLGTTSMYWYSKSYGNVPWPRDWVSQDSTGSDIFKQNLVIHFVRSSIGSSGVVTSIKPATNSPITIKRCGTQDDATTGDLELDVDLSVNIEDSNLGGWNVVKDAAGSKLKRGPVVEKLVAGEGITLTQSGGAPSGQGIVRVSLTSNSSFTGDFEEVALQNAKEEIIGMFPYIRLLPWTTGGAFNTPSGFVCKFRVPHTVPEGVYRVLVYATVFGETEIPYVVDSPIKYAGVTLSYSILPDFTQIGSYPVTTSLANPLQPTTARTVAIPFGDSTKDPIYTAYDPILIHNNSSETGGANVTNVKAYVLGTPIPSIDDFPDWSDSPDTLGVSRGTLVGIRIQRANVSTPATEYTAGIGFINLRWALTPV